MKSLAAVFIILLAEQTGFASMTPLHNGWYDDHFPVPVLHVEGSLEDVAKAHGALMRMKPEMKKTLLFYSQQIEEKLSSNPTLKKNSTLRKLVYRLYTHFIRNTMVEHVPDKYLDAYRVFAREAGFEFSDVLNALVVPDVALRMVSFLYKFEEAPLLLPNLGCTSVIWDAGPSSVLHGRNLDYEGVGLWDETPLIMHIVPKDGLAHVAVVSAGIQAPGITAFNEAGLTLAIHQLTFNNAQSTGTPLAVISAEVIAHARTIDDAIAIIKSFPRAGGWAYILSKGHDRAVVEASPTDVAVRRSSESFFYQTNHVSSPALSVQQVFYDPGAWLDSFVRAERLSHIKDSSLVKGSWATPTKMVQILGDRPRVAGATIAKLDNVQSVVMNATSRSIWIGIGTKDKAPNEGHFVEYRWKNLRQAEPPHLSGEKIQASSLTTLSGKGQEYRSQIRKALAASTRHEKFELMSVNSTTEETWPASMLMAFQILKNSEDSAQAALNALTSAYENLTHFSNLAAKNQAGPNLKAFYNYRLMQTLLYRGRALDLLDRRSEALLEYYRVSRSSQFARLVKAANAQLKKPYRWSDTKSLNLDWASLDVYRN